MVFIGIVAFVLATAPVVVAFLSVIIPERDRHREALARLRRSDWS